MWPRAKPHSRSVGSATASALARRTRSVPNRMAWTAARPVASRITNIPMLTRIRGSDFLLNNHTVEPRFFEPKSLLPETDFCSQRHRRRNGSGRPRRPLQRLTHASYPANSALLAQSWEISVSEEMRGGGRSQSRTCLSNNSKATIWLLTGGQRAHLFRHLVGPVVV
jgi:hypothetical protein